MFHNFDSTFLDKPATATGHLGRLVVSLMNFQQADLRQKLFAMNSQVGQASPATDTWLVADAAEII